MNTSMGESYQDRVRYYRRQREQSRTEQRRYNKSANDVNIDFDEALYHFKNSSGFDGFYSKTKRHARAQLSFYRDDEQGFIGGVCAGIADKMRWDVSVVRIVTVLMGLLFTLPTLIAYICATLFLRKKSLAFYGQNERNFWKSRARKQTRQNASFEEDQ